MQRHSLAHRGFWFFAVFALSLGGWRTAALAVDEFSDLIRIDRLPTSDREVESAFRRTRGTACEIVAAGEPVEIASFTSRLTLRDRRSRELAIPASRQEFFSVGLEFSAADRVDLPLLSRNQITDYVADHYVSIQGRVRRDLLDRQLYYHHRPIAVTAKYRGPRISHDFEAIISNTVQDFHGLGLFVAEEPVIEKPSHFRTMVMIFRTPLLRGGRTIEQFELVIIRGRESGLGDRLDSHVFVTTENRTKLHYLRSQERPMRASQSTILGQIAVTEFDSTGLYPEESAARSYRLAQRLEFNLRDLDAYCRDNRLEGGFGRQVDRVLDEIIDGNLQPVQLADGL